MQRFMVVSSHIAAGALPSTWGGKYVRQPSQQPMTLGGAVQGCATDQDSLPGQSDVDGLGSVVVSGMRDGNDIDISELIETNRAIRQAHAALRPVQERIDDHVSPPQW
jgi:hypothetical protein